MGQEITRTTLNQANAKFSLQQVLVPKLLYPLTTTNFLEEQFYTILKPILASALPAMGINQHFPQAVAHGPRSHQGLEIPNLFTEQICAHITTLLQFGFQPMTPQDTYSKSVQKLSDWRQV